MHTFALLLTQPEAKRDHLEVTQFKFFGGMLCLTSLYRYFSTIFHHLICLTVLIRTFLCVLCLDLFLRFSTFRRKASYRDFIIGWTWNFLILSYILQ